MTAADLRFLRLIEKFLSRNPSVEEIQQLIDELTACLELPVKDEAIGDLPPAPPTYWDKFKAEALAQAQALLGGEL